MKRLALIGMVVTFSLLYSFSCYAGDQEVAKSLVEKAAASIQDKGTDYTLKLLNTMTGPFRKGSIYVFAISMDGVTLSHPTNKKLRNMNVINLKDTNGKEFVKEFLEVANGPGSGWVEYYWKRHGEKQGTLKRSYIMKVPGKDLILGAGYYIK
jgi:cytochrome c